MSNHRRFASLLLAIEDDLSQDADLDALTRRAGYSPFHFHRLFSQEVGESPKQHVQRLRLERAAYLLAITEQRVAAIAFSVGFASHESFSRAFRTMFAMSPSGYRAAAQAAQRARLATNVDFAGDGCVLSRVWFGMIPATQLLALRHLGPYGHVPTPFSSHDTLWRTVQQTAAAHGIECETTPWVICLDDPTLTPPAQQRLDAALPVRGPCKAVPGLKSLEFAGGLYAGAEHRGPPDTLIQAYRHVADGIRRSETFAFNVGPPVEIMRHIDADPAQHRTEVYFPVVRR